MNQLLCDGQAEWNVNPPVAGKVRYLQRASLNLKAKLWSAFLIGVLMPILHSNTLTKKRLWCLFALMKREPIDLGLLIASEMIDARNTRNTSLPYAKLISVLMHKNGIPLKFYQQTFGKGPIDTSYFNQHIFGLPPKKAKSTAAPATTVPVPPTSQPSSSSSQLREPTVEHSQRMQTIETSLGECKAELVAIRAHLTTQDERMEALQADVKKCLMLLLGKPEASYVPPRPQQNISEEESESGSEEDESETASEE